MKELYLLWRANRRSAVTDHDYNFFETPRIHLFERYEIEICEASIEETRPK